MKYFLLGTNAVCRYVSGNKEKFSSAPLQNAESVFQVGIMKAGVKAIKLWLYIGIIRWTEAINYGILVILSRGEFQTNKDISSHLSPVRMQYDCISVQSDCGQWEDLIRKN